jgi:hypothetical protein
MDDRRQGRLRVYMHLVTLIVPGCSKVTDSLDDLPRLQQWLRRKAGFARARMASYGAQPERRAASGPHLGGRRRALSR